MKNISTLNKEKKLKEIILHINSLLSNQLSAAISIPEKIDKILND